MFLRTMKWVIAALIAAATMSVGCVRAQGHVPAARARAPLNAQDVVVHAFDTDMEMRLIDRLELDHLLRDRDIHLAFNAAEGRVSIRGAVRSAAEKERVSEVIRGLPGVRDVSNELDIRPRF